MEVNKGLLAFFAEEEVAVGVVVHEEVFGEDGGNQVHHGGQKKTGYQFPVIAITAVKTNSL